MFDSVASKQIITNIVDNLDQSSAKLVNPDYALGYQGKSPEKIVSKTTIEPKKLNLRDPALLGKTLGVKNKEIGPKPVP
jgi:hypothetical protein